MTTPHDDLRARLLAEAIEYHRHQASGTPDQYGNRPVKPNIALESWHTNVADMLSARPAGETVWQMRVTGGSWHDCSHDDVVRAANCAAIEARVLYTIPQPAPAALGDLLPRFKLACRTLMGIKGEKQAVYMEDVETMADVIRVLESLATASKESES